jgi:hypothetical protein
VKGLYKKARAGEIKNFTGVSDPYEAPENPDMDINTAKLTVEECVDSVLKRLFNDNILADNKNVRISESLYETISEEEQLKLKELKSLDIDLE